MIKLIASDMDGTLLDENGNFPPEFFNVLNELFKRNIKFAVASGRSYSTLKEQFSEVESRISFICDNGAYVVDNSKLSFISIIDKPCISSAAQLCEELGARIILCGTKGIYLTGLDEREAEETLRYYINPIYLDNLCDVDDDIFKIAVLDMNGIENGTSERIINEFSDEYTVQVSGEYWLDIMNKEINKGSALKTIMDKYEIKAEETMAFGDYLNDIEMLDVAGLGYAVINAHSEVKKKAKFIAPPNTEYGVISEIKKQLALN